MPASQSAGDLIKGSLRLIGAIATGETPSAAEANDGLNSLNDVLEAWSLENLSVWTIDNQTFSSVAGQGVYSIGPTGNFATVRPVRIAGAFATFSGIDFPIEVIGEDRYNAIGQKTQQQSFPSQLVYLNTTPLGTLKFWPVPSGAIPIVLNINQVLTQVPNLQTVIGFPPGYFIAMKHALAILLAADYGIVPSAAITQVAQATKADLKRANRKTRTMSFDPAFLQGSGRLWLGGYTGAVPTNPVVPVASAPTFTPAAGTYTAAQTVTLATATPGAILYYTLDGSTPTTSSPVYTAPLTVSATTTVSAIAAASGFSTSAVSSATFTISPVAASPTFSPAAGTYSAAQSVTLASATGGAVIHYTVDGSTPTSASAVYSAALNVAATETIKAIAVATGYTTSPVASAAYTITIPTAALPTFSPPAGVYTGPATVTLMDSTPGAVLYYTLDGSTPTMASAVYSAPLTVSATETIKAIAAATGYTTSGVASATYTINVPTAAAPTFTPAAGVYSSAQSVTIASSTTGAVIHYTLDGSTPTTGSAVYTTAVNVAATETIKAIASATGYTTSSVSTAPYTISAGGTPVPVAFGSSAGLYAIWTAGSTVTNGGIDTASSALDEALVGASLTAAGVTFNFGAPNVADALQSVTLPLAAGNYTSLQFLGLGLFGAQTGQVFTVTYTDSSTSTITQSVSDWGSPSSFSGETTVLTMAHRLNSTGGVVAGPFYLYQYAIPLNVAKTVQSFTVPTNNHLVVLAVDLIPAGLPAAATPTFSEPAGAYSAAQSITLSCSTTGAVIYYTTDGSTPTTASSVCTGPISVSTLTTVNAIAAAGGYANSAVASATYTIGQVKIYRTGGSTGAGYWGNASGGAVALRGMNSYGLSSSYPLGCNPAYPWDYGGWNEEDSSGHGQQPRLSLMTYYGANAVRVPLNSASWLAGADGTNTYHHCWCPAVSGSSVTSHPALPTSIAGETFRDADPNGLYRGAVRAWVAAIIATGKAAVISLHWDAPDVVIGGTTYHQMPLDQNRPLPNTTTGAAFWASIAADPLFKNNPRVIFDVFNEPFPYNWGTWLNGGSMTSFYNGGPSWNSAWTAMGMQALVNAVRAQGANNPIIVGGDNYAGDTSQWLSQVQSANGGAGIDPGVNQVACSFHFYVISGAVYPYTGDQIPYAGSIQYTGTGAYLPAIAAAGFPIFIGELGDYSAGSGTTAPVASACTAYVDSQNATTPGSCGITAWGFDPSPPSSYNQLIQYATSGSPPLAVNPTAPYGANYLTWMQTHT